MSGSRDLRVGRLVTYPPWQVTYPPCKISRNSARAPGTHIIRGAVPDGTQPTHLSTHPPPDTMLYQYPSKHFANHYEIPTLDYTSYFRGLGQSIEEFEDKLIPSIKSCTGAKFVRNETGVFPCTMFERKSNVNLLWWTTKNFKGEDRVCAVCLFELMEDDSLYLWNLFFTTCDPMSLDNFSHPLGLNEKRVRGNQDEKKPDGTVMIDPILKCIEQVVFLERKCLDHRRYIEANLKSDPDYLEKLRQTAVTSRFLGSTGLREMLGYYASDTRTAVEKKRDMESCSDEQFEQLEKEEKQALRAVVLSLTPKKFFYECYEPWLEFVSDLPTHMYPAEYKKRGRWFLLSLSESKRWDSRVFLYLVSARAAMARESPFDSALWLNSQARVFTEVSSDDARYAIKTPGKDKKLGDMLDEDGIAWLIQENEKLVVQQGEFLAKLKKAIDAKDYEAALNHLTEGTAEPFNGQAILGLSEALLRDLTLCRIVFPLELMNMIKSRLDNDWSLYLLDVHTTEDPAEKTFKRLFMIGEPCEALAERAGSAHSM